MSTVYRHKVDTQMTTSTLENRYIIDRKAASRLLKTSLRTVDRYVRQKKLSTRRIDGRIWLNEGEIRTLKDARQPKIEVVNVDTMSTRMSIDKTVYSGVDSVDSMSPSLGSQMYRREGEEAVYKRLYEDLFSEHKEYEDRLNRATYRLGQVEAQLKYSVPLLQHHKEKRLLTASQRKLESELTMALQNISEVERDYRIEKFNKHIYLTILLGLLVLQPIFWLLLR